MITYCAMTQDRHIEIVHCLEKYLPYVDRAVIIDGGSRDDTLIYLRNWAKKEPKINIFLVPWKDNFSAQRNEYLSRVQDNTWTLVSDPDEVFEESTLKALPVLVQEAEKRGCNMVGFQCRSVSYEGPVKVWESLDNYWKRLLFKKVPGLHYVGNPHENLTGMQHRIMDTKFIYEHRKQNDVIWLRGARNCWIGGGGPNLGRRSPYWIKLRQITDSLGIRTWHEFDAYWKKGNIDQRLKNEFRKYLDLKELFPGMTDGLSEYRELYKTYFRILHPEEESEEMKGVHIE